MCEHTYRSDLMQLRRPWSSEGGGAGGHRVRACVCRVDLEQLIFIRPVARGRSGRFGPLADGVKSVGISPSIIYVILVAI